MIDEAIFKNYLALRDVSIELAKFTVIVGPNACGKTSLLEGLNALRSGVHVSYMKSAGFNSGYSQIECRRKSGIVRLGEGSGLDGDLLEAGLVLETLKKSELVRFSTERLRAPAPHQSSGQRISSDGSGLGAALADVMLEDPSRRDRISLLLRSIVPSALGVFAKRASGTEAAYEVEVEFDKIGRVPASRLSEGTLFALGLLTLLTAPSSPKLVLIDDIDKGLHPSAQVELVKILRAFLAADPELQIIATTHSPYLLDNFEPEEVRVMTLGEDGFAMCRKLTDHPKFAKWEGALAAGEMWSSVGESWIRELPTES
jgi:predicted ATPase